MTGGEEWVHIISRPPAAPFEALVGALVAGRLHNMGTDESYRNSMLAPLEWAYE